ncbi:response regulator [Cyanobium sp. CH-040]|nr:response regulator [Cyanobium sp. CH-040]
MDVLVVEDDPILRDFLVEEVARLPVPGGHPVRQAATLAEARRALEQRPPHWVLLDIRLPDGSGLDLCPQLLQARPSARILVLTGCQGHSQLPAPLVPHVHALLSKAKGLEPLRRSIWSLSREFDRELPDLSCLSPRQREILLLLGEGLDTAEIAERLGITFSTAQTHRRQITSRLGLKGSRLIAMARELSRSCA